ncbi:MAG TPA: right-handed parallel beta-helix repeat-containing protein [Xanthomonadaceae bacterium]|nr:right-handed parallel beta-helix repeat-containing protein [Xanthomonadaceae bacterium]
MGKLETGVRGALSRRVFLIGAAAVPVAAGLLGANAFARSRRVYLPPVRSRGSAVISVRDKGAVGDGQHDDTAAIQAAISALPATGGTVVVPAGTYLVDTTKRIRLRSNMLLRMDAEAKLVAKPSSVSRAYILYINDSSDVEISGGQLVGERDRHRYMTSSTDEWNHGLQILGGVRVTVRDLRVGDCTGDGICIGGGSRDVEIANVVSTNNRRQGLSITNCSGIRVHDSEFSHTNGTSPECGIDIEPDEPYSCSDVLIRNCRLNNNAKYGLNVWKRSSQIRLENCVVEDNGSCGVVFQYCGTLEVKGNTVRNNSATGLLVNDGTSGCRVHGNLSYGNYNRLGTKVREPFTLTGWSSKIERDILMRGTLSDVEIGTNNYR